MEMEPMHRSRALAEAGYDADRRVPRLRFRHGGVYDYADVPPEVFGGLVTAAHPWTEWQDHIRASYSFTRLE